MKKGVSLGIKNRQKQDKLILLDQLEKTPIIQIACEKTWIARATYYRWIKDDKIFAENAKKALQKWIAIMNDLAESQLLKSVKDWNMTGIIFWLKSRHPSYWMKVEITDVREKRELTENEKKIIKEVLKKYK